MAIETGTFRERLAGAVRANSSLLCIGLDPVPNRLPPSVLANTDATRAIVAFNAGIISATSDLVCAYKPNLAFYLAHGRAGVAALEETRRLIPDHIPVILDAKVGDMGSTAEAYAAAYFDTWGFDAVTVNPYLGEESLAPFLRRPERGVIVLCKTSNPRSGDLQDISTLAGGREQPLYLTVADRVATWAERWPATSGLVVGATYPEALAAVRGRCPEAPILLPGIGAQAGDLAASLQAGLDGQGRGLMVSASRSIIFAGSESGDDWPAAVRSAAVNLRDSINAIRAA